MHHLANNPTVPTILQHAFQRVTHQLVRTYDDGSEAVLNYIGADRAERERERHSVAVGHVMPSSGRTLVSVTVKAV